MTTRQLRRPLVLLLLAGLAALVPAGRADAAPGDPVPKRALTVQADGLGALPDATGPSGACGTDATWQYHDLTFTTTGLVPGVERVSIFMDMTHPSAGDLAMALIAPDGVTQTPLVWRAGATTPSGCGDATGLAGIYGFYDGSQVSVWDRLADLGPDESLPSQLGFHPSGSLSGVRTQLDAPFVGADPNGTWRLRIYDTAVGESGRVDHASLTLRVTAAGCAEAIAASELAGERAQRASLKRVGAKEAVVQARAALRRAHHRGDPARIARARERRAEAGAALARAKKRLYRASELAHRAWVHQVETCYG